MSEEKIVTDEFLESSLEHAKNLCRFSASYFQKNSVDPGEATFIQATAFAMMIKTFSIGLEIPLDKMKEGFMGLFEESYEMLTIDMEKFEQHKKENK